MRKCQHDEAEIARMLENVCKGNKKSVAVFHCKKWCNASWTGKKPAKFVEEAPTKDKGSVPAETI